MIIAGRHKPTFVVWCNGRFYRRPGINGDLMLDARFPHESVFGFMVPLGEPFYRVYVDGVMVFLGDQIRVERGRRYPDVTHYYLSDSDAVTRDTA